MSKFDFMTFGISAGDRDSFVAHARKYTKEKTIGLCVAECDDLFTRDTDAYGRKRTPLRLPTIDDVQSASCAFRFGISPEYPDGAYTIVDDDKGVSFPVHVIDFGRLKNEPRKE